MNFRILLAVPILSLLATATAAHAKAPPALTAWPVTGMQTVAADGYRDASAAAAGGAAPIDIALRVVGPFEGRTQHLVQSNEGVESPVRSTVTVIRDGLLDDSIRAERWEIRLSREGGGWKIDQVMRAWSCRRGADPYRFGIVRCP